ncbi:MAG: DUF2281 domain-containing protein [Chitinophagales bacterium]
MNLQAKKLELISQLVYVEDESIIQQIDGLIKKALQNVSISLKTKEVSTPIPLKFGAAKDMIQYMAEDFNEPIDDFKDYM